MNKIILIILVLILSFLNCTAQTDSLKQFKTKNIDILYYKKPPVIVDTAFIETDTNIIKYTDCNLIRYINDTSFLVTHNAGSNFILFKNIRDFSVPTDKTLSKKGLEIGMWIGLAGGIVLDVLYGSSEHPGRESSYFSFFNYILYPIFTVFIGGIIGGTIGFTMDEHETINISNYPINFRREKSLNVLLKYRVNF